MVKSIFEKRKKFKLFLIKNQTPTEIKFHIFLKKHSIKHHRQYIISPYLADFYVPQKGLVIELDGGIHKKNHIQVKDHKKEMFLFSIGLMILRYKNNADFNKILKNISSFRDKNEEEFKKIHWFISQINAICCYKGYRNSVVKIISPSHFKEVFNANEQLRKKFQQNKNS